MYVVINTSIEGTASLADLSPDVHVIEVPLVTAAPVHAIPSILTVISPSVDPNPVPVIVMVSPPSIQPNMGLIAVTVGVSAEE